MDKNLELFLIHVHPDLAKVIRAASQSPQPFEVIYGIRSIKEEEKAVAIGHSTTMHSRHLPNKDGLSCAVDVVALTNGHMDWAKGREEKVYGQIVLQVKQASLDLDIPVEFGYDWKTFKDYGHIQLPWDKYP